VTAGWVAASTRGRALNRRLLGSEGARQMAGSASWPEARAHLQASFYGTDLPAGADRATARTATATATVWQLRVLAGWLPVGGSGLARLFAAPIEIANIERHLVTLQGGPAAHPVPLGALAVAWPRVAETRSPEHLVDVLTHSAWGDPGGFGFETLAVGLRVAWARRLIGQVPVAAEWAKGGLAVLIAREIFAFERDLTPPVGREVDRLLGKHWRDAATLPALIDALPDTAAWALEEAASDANLSPAELWRAEVSVARRVGSDAATQAATRRHTKDTVAALMALLLLDLRRVLAAIEVAGRGPNRIEVFDAVA